jgi:hypothetical protein
VLIVQPGVSARPDSASGEGVALQVVVDVDRDARVRALYAIQK